MPIKKAKTASELGVAKPQPERLVWSVEEAAKILGISRACAYQYAREGKLPVIRFGTRTLIPKAAIERLLTSV
jgi:excisionase family DNA binding protein